MSSERLRVAVGFASDKGKVREINEDSFCVFTPFPGSESQSEFQAVLGVADGMGGHQAGDLASGMVSGKLNAAFVKGQYKEKYGLLPDFSLILKSVVRDINLELYTLSKKGGSPGDMGSTLTFGVIKDDVLYLTHVGDSRCYRAREGAIEQLTKDHSWVADQVRFGVLSQEEAVGHPRDNVITQAIGIDPNIEPQILTSEVAPGERYVFCTDGLTKYVSAGEILKTISDNSHPQRACDLLIESANQRGGEDNVTVVLGYVENPLTKTREEELPRFPETVEEKVSRPRKSKFFIIALLSLLLLGGGFLLGSLTQRLLEAKKINELLLQGQTLYQGGEVDKAALIAESILKIDKRHKGARKLIEMIDLKKERRKE